MAKSRSQKESDPAPKYGDKDFVGPPTKADKFFAGDRQSAGAFYGMSKTDKTHVNTALPWHPVSDEKTAVGIKNRNEKIRNLAGAPGAYTTKPGGDIKNSREESSELRSGNVNQTKLLHELEESNRPKKPKKK